MWRYLIPLALAMACSGDEAPKEPGPTKVVKAKAKPPPEAPTFEERLEEARGKSLAGGDEALTTAEALLAEKPEDDSVWRLLAAAAGGRERAVYDRLDATQAIGGRAELHHALRAELALASGLAVEAAAAAKQTGAEDVAAPLIVRAILAGAPRTEADGGSEGLAALLTFATEKRLKPAQVTAAEAVSGWRAAALRAEVHAGRGETEAALKAWEVTAKDADPRAQIAGEAGRAAMGSSGAAPMADALGWAIAGTKVALAEGDRAAVDAGLKSVEALAGATRSPAAAAEVLGEARTALEAAGATDAAATLGVRLAALHLQAGQVVAAYDTAEAARAAATQPELQAQAAWTSGLAAYALGRSAAVDAAAEHLDGAPAGALQALGLASQGKRQAAVALMPLSGLSLQQAAAAYLALGRVAGDAAPDWLERSMSAADRSGDPVTAVAARLALEAAVRVSNPRSARDLRTALARSAGDAPGLTLELGARRMLAGERADFAADDGKGAQIWAALAGGSTPDPGLAESWTEGVRLWANGRAAAGSRDDRALDQYVQALAHLPLHRQGLLGTGTVLDGSAGLDVDQDLTLLAGQSEDPALGAALAAHEVGHRLGSLQSDVVRGRDFLAGLETAQRESVLSAAAAVRAGMALYQAGGAAPMEALNAYVVAEKTAGESSVAFARLQPTAGITVESLRELSPRAAILSFRLAPSGAHGVVLTPAGGGMRGLGKSDRIQQAAAEQASSLAAAAQTEERAQHRTGDRLRSLLLDPFIQELTGYGRYLVIADEPLLQFPFTTFPEQSAGLRYLADIRTMCVSQTLRDLFSGKSDGQFKPDYLALASPSEGVPDDVPVEEGAEGAEGEKTDGEKADGDKSKKDDEKKSEKLKGRNISDADLMNRYKKKSDLPVDILSGQRNFGEGFREIKTGPNVRLATWNSLAAAARYIHISDVPMASDGGFKLADGDLRLSDIRATPIKAQMVMITAPASAEVQLARVRALFDAGAEAVAVTLWEVPDPALERMMDGFYQALNRDRNTTRVLGQARETLLRDALIGKDFDRASIWGSLVLFAVP